MNSTLKKEVLSLLQSCQSDICKMETLFYPIILILFFLLLYFLEFHSGLSSSSNDWGNFGSYFGAISSIILSCSVFWYTNTIDRKHQSIEDEKRIIELIKIVSESFVDISNLEDLNVDINNLNIRDFSKEQMREQLSNRILTNYKMTQILTSNLFNKKLPNIGKAESTKPYFTEAYNIINKKK